MSPWQGNAPQKRPDPPRYSIKPVEFLGEFHVSRPGSDEIDAPDTPDDEIPAPAAISAWRSAPPSWRSPGRPAPPMASRGRSEAFDSKIIRSILEGIGLRDGPNINYQERAPLVIPPRLELPPVEPMRPPRTIRPGRRIRMCSAPRKRRRSAKNARGRRPPAREEQRCASGRTGGRPHEPAQPRRRLSHPSHGYGSQVNHPRCSATRATSSARCSAEDEEVAQFTNEPPRAQLTDPPPGYRTPSPAQPYGLGKPSASAAEGGRLRSRSRHAEMTDAAACGRGSALFPFSRSVPVA